MDWALDAGAALVVTGYLWMCVWVWSKIFGMWSEDD